MSKQTAKSLFMVSSMPRLYQHLLSGIASYEALGNRIVKQIKAAHAFRQTDTVKELSRILINIPIKEYQLIGQYYLIWCKCRVSQYNSEVLERIIDQTRTYKSKALISRAAFEGYQMNTERELYFYTEALKSRPTVSEHIDILKSIAVIKAKEGFHQSALRGLENLIPMVRYAEPLVYFDVLNSYAVELGEVGRKDEARNVSRLVLASPFAHAYPEWRETAQELKPANRSFVAINPLTGRNVLRFTPAERTEETEASAARVLPFMAKKEDQSKADEPEMTKAEKALWLRRRILGDDFPEHILNKMIKILEEEGEK